MTITNKRLTREDLEPFAALLEQYDIGMFFNITLYLIKLAAEYEDTKTKKFVNELEKFLRLQGIEILSSQTTKI